MLDDSEKFVRLAIAKSQESVNRGGFPAGAIIVRDGQVIGEGISIGSLLCDPTSHGEMDAIRNACKNTQQYKIPGSTLYASMQPCLLCFAAANNGMITKIVYACAKTNVSVDYYGETFTPEQINDKLLNPIEVVHLKALEDEALKIVRMWEKSLAERKDNAGQTAKTT